MVDQAAQICVGDGLHSKKRPDLPAAILLAHSGINWNGFLQAQVQSLQLPLQSCQLFPELLHGHQIIGVQLLPADPLLQEPLLLCLQLPPLLLGFFHRALPAQSRQDLFRKGIPVSDPFGNISREGLPQVPFVQDHMILAFFCGVLVIGHTAPVYPGIDIGVGFPCEGSSTMLAFNEGGKQVFATISSCLERLTGVVLDASVRHDLLGFLKGFRAYNGPGGS